MDAIFLKIVNMSITAGWLVLAVILLRLLFRQAPKWMMGILWGFVALRLSFPFSIESVFSLIPSSETLPNDILTTRTPAINGGNLSVNDSLSPNVGDSINPVQVITSVATVIWLVGIVAMLIYTLVSLIRMKRRVSESVCVKENIWMCDRVSTPFILGIIKPRIYLPSAMNEKDTRYVIAHEKAHLKRRDHIWKPLGFLFLSVYWFNPVLWVAYVLFCRDIELACDEKVVKELGNEMKKPYSEALINCSVPRKMITACPLAFGEVGVKERVKSVLNYKRPSFWIIFVAVIASLAVAIVFLTNPKDSEKGVVENVSLSDIGEELIYEFNSDKNYAMLSLLTENKKCRFSLSVYSSDSSCFPMGTYEETDEYLVMKADDGEGTYTFRKEGNDLVFVASKSSAVPSYVYLAGEKAETCIPDGAVFSLSDSK